MIEPLELSFPVACPRDHAFEVWTTRFAAWWPKGHSTSGDPDTDVVLEPTLGGRIYERTSQGEEINWGEVTVWEPPERLGYLWHIGRSRDGATDVLLTFVALDDGSTRIDIHHAGWDRLGAEGREWRDRNTAGWGSLLPHFVAAATATTDRPPDPAT